MNLTTLQVAVATGLPVSPNCADGIAVDPSSSAVFVLTSPTTIRVLNSTNGDVLLSSVTVGSNVTSIAYDPADNQVYAAGDQVSLLNGSSFQVDFPPVAIGVSHRVLGEIYEPSRKDVYIASVGLLPGEQGIVSVLDGSSGAATEGSLVEIPVGESPVAFGIVTPGNTSTPGSAMVWVANELSGTVSVISSPPEITSFSSSPSTIDLGFPTTILVTYQGGAGESDVSYGGLPSGCSSASKLMVNCTPNVSGTFILAVNLTDSFGFSANATTGLIVESSLAVRTSFSPSTLPNIDPGIPLRGTAAASDGSPPYSFSWSFSDGNVSSGPSVSHSFSLPGVFVVTAEVRDSTGATNTSSSTVVVVASPSAAVSVNPGNVTDVNIPLVFKGTITGGVGTVRQNWSFADGTTSLGPNATHTWTRAGNYTVDFSSSDALGVMSSRSLDVRVNPSLTATFGSNGGSASNPSAPATPVTFTSNASGGTRPYNVEWSFGDESSSPGLTVNHSYATSGTYSVKVTLSDSVGASVSTNLTVVVAQSSNSSGGLSSLSGGFGSGLFLGLVSRGSSCRRRPIHRRVTKGCPAPSRTCLSLRAALSLRTRGRTRFLHSPGSAVDAGLREEVSNRYPAGRMGPVIASRTALPEHHGVARKGAIVDRRERRTADGTRGERSRVRTFRKPDGHPDPGNIDQESAKSGASDHRKWFVPTQKLQQRCSELCLGRERRLSAADHASSGSLYDLRRRAPEADRALVLQPALCP